jgi:hypothetical protein
VWPEGLGKLKNSPHRVSNPATFRLVASCLNHYATEYRPPRPLTGIALLFYLCFFALQVDSYIMKLPTKVEMDIRQYITKRTG